MAVLELHIYGPAFNLPSIDARCLATIALIQSNLASDDWCLVPSSDPVINAFRELPALKDGALWVTGFRNIASYLKVYGDWQNATAELSEQQAADSEAYLSFLESRGIPLLDLSLYVSSDNYTTCTRSALAEITPWPQSWTIPQQLRDDARKRSEHLGLSGLDVDAIREKELKQENEGIAAQIPKSLRRPKQTVTALLGSTAEQTRFRLEAVTADFFEPLEELLGEKKYFLSDEMTALDCLVLGILAQMQIADLPQPWLKHALEKKYPKLSVWTKENTEKHFGPATNLRHRPLAERSWTKLAFDVFNSITDSIPINIAGAQVRKHSTETKSTKNRADYEQKHMFHVKACRQQSLMREIVVSILSSAGLVGTLLYVGVLSLPQKKPPPTRRNFGEAGALLGLR
ncbi:hypothetical protein H2198_006959 [Neophaeococcomyces mojaviensis]|uniref:Uncharacterized protein n=1 Tax=Neophaeococcomyces mojaviensis TaxID=3383035 RepID=A0ACC3A1B5_9EURO|nr:hypothetical protein H2198_006959 [Knufia sp. JES_112]